jgi:hypothetical protein
MNICVPSPCAHWVINFKCCQNACLYKTKWNGWVSLPWMAKLCFNNQGIYLFQLLNLWHALLTLGSNTLWIFTSLWVLFLCLPTKAFLHSNTRMFYNALSHQCLQLSLYFPTHLPIYETYLLQNCLPRWNQILTQLRFIHNWVIMDIQWMVRWWVLVHCGQVNRRSVNIDTRYLPSSFFNILGATSQFEWPIAPKKMELWRLLKI